MKNNVTRISLFLMLMLTIIVSNVNQASAQIEPYDPYPEHNLPPCPTTFLARNEMDKQTAGEMLKLLYHLRDDAFSRSEYGRGLTKLYYQHAGRITYLLATNHQLRANAMDLLINLDAGIRQVTGEKNSAILSDDTLNQLQIFLDELATLDHETSKGRSRLSYTIDLESKQIEWDQLAGLNYIDAWKQVSQGKR